MRSGGSVHVAVEVTVACDDAKPCTVDTCDKVAGCKSSPTAAGVACGSNATCDGKGACELANCVRVVTSTLIVGALELAPGMATTPIQYAMVGGGGGGAYAVAGSSGASGAEGGNLGAKGYGAKYWEEVGGKITALPNGAGAGGVKGNGGSAGNAGLVILTYQSAKCSL